MILITNELDHLETLMSFLSKEEQDAAHLYW